MTGEPLLRALRRMIRRDETAVTLISLGYAPALLSTAQALAMAATGLYTGRGTTQRVFELMLTPPPPKLAPVWRECWRTTQAATLSPSPEWMRSVGA